jgi:hypothetical protein
MTRIHAAAAAMMLCLGLSTQALAQSSNATLGGTVSDATGALMPGVTITGTNTQTGIISTGITNETGAYQFAALQPGIYKVSAELPGFRTQTYNDVMLGISQQVRLNFTLQVSSVAQSVDVSVAADTLIATTSASVGSVLPEYKVRDLPLINRNVMDLITTTPGVSSSTSFAGSPTGFLTGNMINTTRDGISVQQGRYNNGAYSATFASNDLVEEVRVIVAPADAETGRGSGQVQMRTRSGTNQFRGSLFWSNRNSVWDANTFSNNYNKTKPNFLNRNQFGGRLGGPIVRNKTFFFFLYEGMRTAERQTVVGTVLTPTARQGIYRYFPGVQSAPSTAANPTVTTGGEPLTPRGATGPLASFSVFGRDPVRPGFDPSGSIQQLLARMPLPNDFSGTGLFPANTIDGLNTAGHRWVRRSIGSEGFQGTGQNINRDQANLRIDHHFNGNHRLNAAATREHTWADADLAPWPDGYNAALIRHPQVYTASFVSTLSPTLLNEFRFGLRRDRLEWTKAYELDGKVGEESRKFLGQHPSGIPFIVRPALFAANVMSAESGGSIGETNPLWQFGNSLSWNRGKHAFKGGVDVRFGSSLTFSAQQTIPRVDLGPSSFVGNGINAFGRQFWAGPLGIPVNVFNSQTLPGISGPDANRASDLLIDLSGSVGAINQQFNIQDPKNIVFEDYRTLYKRWADIHQNEFSTFFKDDWKIRPNLTLNLGVRYEWYGVPYDANGLMAAPRGGGNGLFGLSGNGFADWFRPGIRGELMAAEFIGKGSPNPDKLLYKNDWNNFGPAVGLSWSLPWFGKDKTVLRAGYGLYYTGIFAGGGGLGFTSAVTQFPGVTQTATHPTTSPAELNIRNIVLPIPERLPSGKLPVVPVTAPVVSQPTYSWDPNLTNPYMQNFNVELQRELMSNLTLEVRYVATKGTKLFATIDLNSPNTIENGMLNAFRMTAAGQDAPLFDNMLRGFNLGSGTINGTTVTGSASLRASALTRGFLANGNPAGLANYLARTAPLGGFAGDYIRTNGYPENLVLTNPQLGQALFFTNPNNSTYHSLQTAVTKRLSHGFTNQSTYTWSRTIATSIVNPRERGNKTLAGLHATHDFRSNGTFELPFGPDRLLLKNAGPVVSRLVEHWQLGTIFSLSSGTPVTLTAGSNPYGIANNFPDVVTALPKSFGKVTKTNLPPGVITYFDGLQPVSDPGRSSVTTLQSLQNFHSNFAVADSQGRLLLVNPAPGTIGTLGEAWFEGPGRIGLDANLVKRVKIDELKELEIRLDAINVLNHPNFGNPTANINSVQFGRIALPTTWNRQFVFNARLNF